MDAAWILVPAVVSASSLLFIDARRRDLRSLGFVLLLGGFLGILAVAYIVVAADERDVARCASLGGVPANGECWINGKTAKDLEGNVE